jgi:hypothetical protein
MRYDLYFPWYWEYDDAFAGVPDQVMENIAKNLVRIAKEHP